MPKTMQKRPRIDYDPVTISKNALGIWYESRTIFRIGEFVAKVLNSSKLLSRIHGSRLFPRHLFSTSGRHFDGQTNRGRTQRHSR